MPFIFIKISEAKTKKFFLQYVCEDSLRAISEFYVKSIPLMLYFPGHTVRQMNVDSTFILRYVSGRYLLSLLRYQQ